MTRRRTAPTCSPGVMRRRKRSCRGGPSRGKPAFPGPGGPLTRERGSLSLSPKIGTMRGWMYPGSRPGNRGDSIRDREGKGQEKRGRRGSFSRSMIGPFSSPSSIPGPHHQHRSRPSFGMVPVSFLSVAGWDQGFARAFRPLRGRFVEGPRSPFDRTLFLPFCCKEPLPRQHPG